VFLQRISKKNWFYDCSVDRLVSRCIEVHSYRCNWKLIMYFFFNLQFVF
jgi:hypothetical protein